jgi:putative hydroxymethylpyrimidine transport system substrate-binding protein
MAILLTIALAGCGGGSQSGSSGSGGDTAKPANVNLSLDWTPNPDHIGLYYAQEKGFFSQAKLNVKMQTPSDPSAPIKLVGLNQVDLAISYEPELFFAGEKDLPIKAVASVIPVPLNSLIALSGSGIESAGAMKGKKVGITGIPADDAILSTLARTGGLQKADVTSVNVGFNLVTSLLSHKVDAILGGYRNVEAIQIEQETGKKPVTMPVDQLGVPSYDELVLVANARRLESDASYADMVKRFADAFLKASKAAQADPTGTIGIMQKATDYKPKFLQESVPATLTLMTPPGGRPLGCLDQDAWRSYGAWMHQTSLLKKEVSADTVMTTQYLPMAC